MIHADSDVSIFFPHAYVFTPQCLLIFQHRNRIGEVDAMLMEIAFSFCRIPFIAHGSNLIICTNGIQSTK